MPDHLQRLAFISVGRAVGFASIAVVMFFLAMAHDLVNALRAAGFLGLLIAMVLLLKARLAPGRPYKHTELWVMLKPPERPEPAIAQRLITDVLRHAYHYFALQAAVFSACALASAIIYGLFRAIT